MPGFLPSFRSSSESLPASVVLPDPCSPQSRITVGGRLAKTSRESPEPISSVSSSWTILTTCWPGVRLLSTSCPVARSRTCATKSLTTWKLTSASSSASRISRIAFEIASSSRRPLPRRSPRACWSLSERVSNTGGQCRYLSTRRRRRHGQHREGDHRHRQLARWLCRGGSSCGHRGVEDAARRLGGAGDVDELRRRRRTDHNVQDDCEHRLRGRRRPLGGRPPRVLACLLVERVRRNEGMAARGPGVRRRTRDLAVPEVARRRAAVRRRQVELGSSPFVQTRRGLVTLVHGKSLCRDERAGEVVRI